MEALIDRIICTKHGKGSNLKINKLNFNIVCKFCENGENNLQIENYNSNDKADDQEVVCIKHINESAQFYCEDCFEFVCKNCFAIEHRSHSSSTINLIVDSIRNHLVDLLKELENMKKLGEEHHTDINEKNEFFKKNKDNFEKYVSEINERINKTLNSKIKEFSQEIEGIFDVVDAEVDSATQRLELNKKKANKILSELLSMSKDINDLKSDIDVCLYKKSNNSRIKDNQSFVNDLEIFLKENITRIKLKSEREIENFNNKLGKFNKNLQIYENSVINTIMSGIPNICMRIRRFQKLFFRQTKYFKSTSLCMIPSQTINFVGFGICGLFNGGQNEIKSIDLEIRIFEIDNVKDFNLSMPIISKTIIKLPLMTNNVDPIYQIYLKNGVTINKDKIYYIYIENISSNKYINIWNGMIKNDKNDRDIENEHTVHCNNSNVRFYFTSTFGVDSDLNEFTGGIISDVVFSFID